MTKIRAVGSVTVLGTLILVLGSYVPAARAVKGSDADKVDVCHLPPGNAGQAHTITIAPSALPSHLAHGDTPGPCPNDCRLFGTTCNDGDACTADSCDAITGECLHGVRKDCDDGNVCTDDSCDPTSGGCVNVVVPARPCDDGDACTIADACQSDTGTCAGVAVAGCCVSAAQCDDGNPCTLDGCTSSLCMHETKACDDGDACTIDSCNPQDGECVAAPKSCDDQDESTIDTCDASSGECMHASACQPIGGLCDSDADCCSDVCKEGLCITIVPPGDPYGPNTDPDAEAAARAGLCAAPDVSGEFCSPWKPCCQPNASCLIYEDSKGLCWDLSEFQIPTCVAPSPADPQPSCLAGANGIYDECCWGFCEDTDGDGYGTCHVFATEPQWDCTRGTDGASGTLFSGDAPCGPDLSCCNGSACDLATGNCHP